MLKTKWRIIAICGISFSFGGCAMFDTVMPPPSVKVKAKPRVEDARSEAELVEKLSAFRKQNTGVSLYMQKKLASSDLDAVIEDAEEYIKNVRNFARKHQIRKKGKKILPKKILPKEIMNDKNNLNFY